MVSAFYLFCQADKPPQDLPSPLRSHLFPFLFIFFMVALLFLLFRRLFRCLQIPVINVKASEVTPEAAVAPTEGSAKGNNPREIPRRRRLSEGLSKGIQGGSSRAAPLRSS